MGTDSIRGHNNAIGVGVVRNVVDIQAYRRGQWNRSVGVGFNP